MPKRPRAHRLEDISIRKFKGIVPETWVVRERSHDYGIDLEVEIFTDAGVSTGLIFYAQLRATDDLTKSKKARLDLDQVEYFHTIEIPTAIVRYCDADGSFHIKWHFEVPPPMSGAASLTLNYDDVDRWDDQSPTRIIETLRAISRVKSYRPVGAVVLRLINQATDNSRRGAFNEALDQLVDAGCGIAREKGQSDTISLTITASNDEFFVAIDKLASVRFSSTSGDAAELFSQVSYSLLHLLYQVGLVGQAARLARLVLEEGTLGPTPGMSMRASVAIASDPASAVQLAVQNGLHLTQGEYFASLVIALHRSGTKRSRVAALKALYDAAIAHHQGEPSDALAALQYSLGNLLRGAGNFSAAVHSYNKARRYRPAYAESEYYCRELAGCLFVVGRHAMAARIYSAAAVRWPSQMLNLLSGDALMMAGEFMRAADKFTAAASGDNREVQLEASVKAALCSQLIETYGPKVVRRVDALNREKSPLDDDELSQWPWGRFLMEFDALDALSNFNLALDDLNANDKAPAFWRFLLVAFAQPRDSEAWFNALACAGSDPTLFAAVLELSVRKCGREPYSRLRAQWVEGLVGADIIAAGDAIIAEFCEEISNGQSDGIMIRLFDGSGFRHVLDVPD